MSFPFSQVIVFGGTGQTGYRLLQRITGIRDVTSIFATSRHVRDGFPGGPLSVYVQNEARRWSPRVRWHSVDLERDLFELHEQLQALAKLAKPGLPTAVILAAAYTNVEGCETEREVCFRVNETNTTAVFEWAQRYFGAKLVFYSSDYVFDGASGPYGEEHPRNPISKYGEAKVHIEEWLESHGAASRPLIIRTTGVFDYLPGSKNFLMQMLEGWSRRNPLRIPSDQFANPVWADDLARATVELLARECSGIYHVAGGARLARSEFALEIARVFGKDPAKIVPVKTRELGQQARRPLEGGLKLDKLRKELGWVPEGAPAVLENLRKVADRSVKKHA